MEHLEWKWAAGAKGKTDVWDGFHSVPKLQLRVLAKQRPLDGRLTIEDLQLEFSKGSTPGLAGYTCR
jgi:hypothetical protein